MSENILKNVHLIVVTIFLIGSSGFAGSNVLILNPLNSPYFYTSKNNLKENYTNPENSNINIRSLTYAQSLRNKEIAYSKGDIKAEIYCEDGKTHKTYTDKCDFTDPTTQKDIEHKINIDVSGGYGTCGIEIYKNNNLEQMIQGPCRNLKFDYIIDNNDVGKGYQNLDIKIYKKQGNNKSLIEEKEITYKVNKAPNIKINKIPKDKLPQEGKDFSYKIASCSDPDGDNLTAKVENLPYGFSYKFDGKNITVSAHPVPYELPNGESLVDHEDPDGDGKWDTLTKHIKITCSDGVDKVDNTTQFVVLDSDRLPYVKEVYAFMYNERDLNIVVECGDVDKEDVYEDSLDALFYPIWASKYGAEGDSIDSREEIAPVNNDFFYEIQPKDIERGYVEFAISCWGSINIATDTTWKGEAPNPEGEKIILRYDLKKKKHVKLKFNPPKY